MKTTYAEQFQTSWDAAQLNQDELEVHDRIWDWLLEDEEARRAVAQAREDGDRILSLMRQAEENPRLQAHFSGLLSDMLGENFVCNIRSAFLDSSGCIDNLEMMPAWREAVDANLGQFYLSAVGVGSSALVGALGSAMVFLCGPMALVSSGATAFLMHQNLDQNPRLREARQSLDELVSLAAKLHHARQEIDRQWALINGEEEAEQ